MKNAEIMQEVASKVVALMEQHGTGWTKPWVGNGGGFPKNVSTGKSYRGINIILLLSAGFGSAEWATFKQWQSKNAKIIKGSKATRIVFWKPLKIEDKDTGKEKTIWMLKTFNVFNAEQVEGYEAPKIEVEPVTAEIECPELEAFIAEAGAVVRHGGGRAFYRPSTDHIQMPKKETFIGTDTSTAREAYYSTLAHEVTHWTGHKSRMDRLAATSKGDKNYAFEELVAELGAVFLSMQFGISPAPRQDHAEYLNSWVAQMKEAPSIILKAASAAQKAMDYLDEAQMLQNAA